MAFALVFQLDDFQHVADLAQDVRLTPALRQRVKKFWDAGLSTWQQAPVGTFPDATEVCPLCHLLVLDGGGGPNDTVTLAAFQQLLYDLVNYVLSLGDLALAHVVGAIANDLGGTDAAREPWP